MQKRKRRNKRKKQRKTIILSTILLSFTLITAYSAFSTTLTLTAKGNIKQVAGEMLKKNVVTEGDGLYLDIVNQNIHNENRYIYRGSNPNNFIKFNNELWRILAVESDSTLKIIRNEVLSNPYSFDQTNSNNWIKPADLNNYLNGDYYNNLLESAKNQITATKFNMGSTRENRTYKEIVENETQNSWNGRIGMISISDWLKASNNINCQSTTIDVCEANVDDRKQENHKCSLDNYLYIDNKLWWTMLPIENSTSGIIAICHGGCLGWVSSKMEQYVRPVVYLKAKTFLKGDGSQDNPYRILPE